ncbi:MAG: CRISPR-associated endonuclease Cas1 [Rhodospirillales bacterium]|nr:CRISPR-associated endonuclease Cas1 [Rhodospirillales bacterium]
MPDDQPELPLPAPPLPEDLPQLPARMVNEFVYCPRLAYLEWVQSEWASSADTAEGSLHHRRTDKPAGALPDAEDLSEDERIHARSLTIASDRLGLIARLDVVESEDGALVPVDYKRGKRPHVVSGAYDPERVQVCVQGLILEEQGYRCDEGVLYFYEGRERVRVAFDAELRARTREAIAGLRLIAAGRHIPPPLEDSPKCPRCSLVGICLPDEVNFLKRGTVNPRPLAVGRDDALPLYVQAQRARIGKQAETLKIEIEDAAPTTARLIDLSQVVLIGNISITTPAVHELMRREIPVSWYSYGGWFLGHTCGVGHKNVELRTAQYRASFDAAQCLALARGLVAAKLKNGRTLLRRNWRDSEPPAAMLDDLKRQAEHALRARGLPELLGIEGSGAAVYFRHLPGALKRDGDEPAFDFATRNRRPPTDPVNALLSFGYALLARTFTATLSAVGFDPYRGFYHQPRYGRPALALDLMEPFRPLIADSAVIQAINNGEVQAADFVRCGPAVALKPDGRKRFIAAFERRLSHEITHPLFGYRVSYRRLLEVQARLLGRWLLGEIPEYPQLVTR